MAGRGERQRLAIFPVRCLSVCRQGRPSSRTCAIGLTHISIGADCPAFRTFAEAAWRKAVYRHPAFHQPLNRTRRRGVRRWHGEDIAEEGHVVMVNLVRFRERSRDGNGSGWDAYPRQEGAAFLAGYGVETGSGWREMVDALNRYSPVGVFADGVEKGAEATFLVFASAF